jgi:hypothetical protein
MAIQHHADFAVPVVRPLWLETSVPHPAADGAIRGEAIALGWWVDPEQADPSTATGTLYLVVDERGGPPRWIAEGDIVSSRVTARAER